MNKLASPTRPTQAIASPLPEDSARLRLLQAAERVLVEEGAGGITVRRLATVAGCNLALASYHFGGLHGLLEGVGNDNLERMIALRSQLLSEVPSRTGKREQLRRVIEAYARPMWMPSCHAGIPTAALVLAPLMSMTRPEFRQSFVERIGASVDETCGRLQPLLPHLDRSALLMRLRFLLGAVRYAEPGHWAGGLFEERAGTAAPSKQAQEQLMRFAEGALLAA